MAELDFAVNSFINSRILVFSTVIKYRPRFECCAHCQTGWCVSFQFCFHLIFSFWILLPQGRSIYKYHTPWAWRKRDGKGCFGTSFGQIENWAGQNAPRHKKAPPRCGRCLGRCCISEDQEFVIMGLFFGLVSGYWSQAILILGSFGRKSSILGHSNASTSHPA